MEPNIYKLMERNHHRPKWRGKTVIKQPEDLVLYAEIIQQDVPDFIIETGTAHGGSALYLADILSLFNPNGHVITIDVKAVTPPVHPHVTYIEASSTDPITVKKVGEMVAGGRSMVILDSDHHGRHILRELAAYSPMVAKNLFIVVEDVYRGAKRWWPGNAVDIFLKNNKDFRYEDITQKYFVAISRGGWMRRIA